MHHGTSDYALLRGLTEEQLKNIPSKIAHPVMIMDSLDESRNSVIVVTDMIDIDNSPIVISIKADGKGMYNIETAVNENRLLYWDKKMSHELFDIPGLQLPDNIFNFDSNVIIRKITQKINDKTVNNQGLQYSFPISHRAHQAL